MRGQPGHIMVHASPDPPLIALSIVHALGHAAREKTLFIANAIWTSASLIWLSVMCVLCRRDCRVYSVEQ